jgi:hypothetical protein
MFSNAKSLALIRDLADRLKVRLSANASPGINQVDESFFVDSKGASWPVLTLSQGGVVTAGSPVVVIQISNVDMVSKDIFGNQTFAYAPHLLQFGYEIGASTTFIPWPSRADLAQIQFEAQTCGCEWQLKEIANGTAATAAALNAAAAIVDIQPLYWPTKSV